jgi:hypothetical protein
MSQRRALDVVLPIVMTPSKNPAQWKATVARINALHDIILLHGIEADSGLSVGDVMRFLVANLESPKVEVRQAVCEAIVTLERILGSGINRHLENVPPRTRREVDKEIEKAKNQ